MSVHKIKFVLVNDMAPRTTSICTACSRPLEQGYLHDLSTLTRYCGIECYPRWMMVGGFVGSFAPTNPFELAIAWRKLTVDVASALFARQSRLTLETHSTCSCPVLKGRRATEWRRRRYLWFCDRHVPGKEQSEARQAIGSSRLCPPRHYRRPLRRDSVY